MPGFGGPWRSGFLSGQNARLPMCFNPGWNLKMARVPFLTEEVTCACLDGKDRPDARLPPQLTTRLDGKGGRGAGGTEPSLRFPYEQPLVFLFWVWFRICLSSQRCPLGSLLQPYSSCAQLGRSTSSFGSSWEVGLVSPDHSPDG